MAELIDRVLDDMQSRRDNLLNGKVNSIPSPFVRFRGEFLGFERSSSMVISSFTKGGKTQFTLFLLFEAMLYCYYNPTKASIKVFYFPWEETGEKITQRFISYILYKIDKIRYSPSDLRSTNNDSPVPQEIIDKLKESPYKELLEYYERVFTFSPVSNPTGVYKACAKYAKDNGTVYTKEVDYNDKPVFDYYVPNDPNEFRIACIDHLALVSEESGMNKKQTIDKLSEYLSVELRNKFGFTTILIQQQSAEVESNDSFKLGRIRPGVNTLGDSKYPGRDVNIMLGLFSPFKFGLPEYLEYDITKFKDRIRFLEVCLNRDGEVGGIIALYFDGATCTFHELPPPSDKAGLEKVYKMLEKQEDEKKKSLSLFIKSLINGKLRNYFR